MKHYFTVSVVLIFACMFYAFTKMEDVIETLGMQHQYAQRSILNNFIGRQSHNEIDEGEREANDSELIYNQAKAFTIPSARMLSTVIQGDKVGATRELCEYVQNYVHSEKFLADYAQARQSATPTSEPIPMDPAMIAELKKGIKEQEKEFIKVKASKQIPAEIIQKMEESIAQQKKMIAASDDPTPNHTYWQKVYPKNPEAMIKARLEEYLKLSTTVDFNAAVTGNGRQKKFTNPAYEKKGLKWKAIYRAGKDVNSVATAFTKEWLQQGVKLASVSSVPTDNGAMNPKNTSTDQSPVSTSTEDTKATPAKALKSLKEKTKKIFN